MLPNHVAFAAPAGWATIFDIAAWHTALPNDSDSERQNVILSYMRDPRFSRAGGCGLDATTADKIEACSSDAMTARRRLLMGVEKAH